MLLQHVSNFHQAWPTFVSSRSLGKIAPSATVEKSLKKAEVESFLFILALYLRLHNYPNIGFPRTLTYENGHQGSNSGDHCFSFLNTSINNKPVFFSEVVTYEKSPRSEDRGLSYSIDSDLCGDLILIILEHKHEKFNTCHDDRAI